VFLWPKIAAGSVRLGYANADGIRTRYIEFGAPVAKEAAAFIPNAEPLILIDDCASWPQWEKADQFNRIHLAFLSRHTDAAPSHVSA
jgi:pimeloyl-ACP methyl ester carboxylesterase